MTGGRPAPLCHVIYTQPRMTQQAARPKARHQRPSPRQPITARVMLLCRPAPGIHGPARWWRAFGLRPPRGPALSHNAWPAFLWSPSCPEAAKSSSCSGPVSSGTSQLCSARIPGLLYPACIAAAVPPDVRDPSDVLVDFRFYILVPQLGLSSYKRAWDCPPCQTSLRGTHLL